MPYANNNITGEEWRVCDRCGFLHPISMLSRQLGMMLCRDHGCWDDISNDRRAMRIAEIIRNSQEGRSDWAEKLKDKGETVFDGVD